MDNIVTFVSTLVGAFISYQAVMHIERKKFILSKITAEYAALNLINSQLSNLGKFIMMDTFKTGLALFSLSAELYNKSVSSIQIPEPSVGNVSINKKSLNEVVEWRDELFKAKDKIMPSMLAQIASLYDATLGKNLLNEIKINRDILIDGLADLKTNMINGISFIKNDQISVLPLTISSDVYRFRSEAFSLIDSIRLLAEHKISEEQNRQTFLFIMELLYNIVFDYIFVRKMVQIEIKILTEKYLNQIRV